MNAEVFAEWMRRQGHHVVRTASSYWHNQGPRVYQAFPYHWKIEPDEDEITHLFRRHGMIGARYSSPLTAPFGIGSYHVIANNDAGSLDMLSKKARYDVRKGLRIGVVEPIPLCRLAADGWILRVETLARQGRAGAENETWWRTLCQAADGLPGFEAWGSTVDGTLVAALLAFTCDDCCSVFFQQSRTAFLVSGVNNALTFMFTQTVLSRPEIKSIFYGLHSLDAPPSVDEFKFRMGYTAQPVRQRVVFHPWLRPLINRASYAALARFARVHSGNPTLAKAEGMLRFYLEGRLPLEQQTWPTCLSGHLRDSLNE